MVNIRVVGPEGFRLNAQSSNAFKHKYYPRNKQVQVCVCSIAFVRICMYMKTLFYK